MVKLESEVRNCDIEVMAGPNGEGGSDVYSFIISRLPSWVKTVDDPIWSLYSGRALQTAKEIVRATGKKIRLNFDVSYQLQE